ncbi:MAG TPA: hypothetical protein VG245_09300, partial [Candidatus Dormibacteraeota bacterium]|nr:hypothetical protein [Candidatus Dormibacteraeota bacterium]
ALIPAAGSSVAPGSTVGADFADETALNQASVVFTLTGPAGTVGLTPTYSPASSQGHPATLITAVIPAGLATGGYTAHLHAADSDQNHRGGDCGEATWAFTVAPPAPAAHLGIVKTVSPSTSPVPVDSTLTYTITVGNSGDGAAQNVGVTDVISANPADMYSVKTASFVANPAAPHSAVTQTAAGSYLWEIDTIPAGGSATLSFSVTVTRAGTISNTGALVGGPSSHVTTVVREEPVGGIAATIELAGTTTTVPGGTVALGSVSQTAYPATFGGLAPNTYCVNATAPAGYTMVGAGQQCVAVTAEHVSQVVFFVTQTPPTTACVLVTIHLAGTGITVPGGSVAVGGQSETLYPFTFCSLTPGQVTAGATAPAGFSLVGPATQTPTLVAGNNPPVVFFVQPNTPAPDCGQVLGEIVLAGSQTVIPGGTVTAGGVTHTTYPTPLFPCVTPGSVPVSATAPAGYQFVGPATTTATVEAGKVTPVIFQVTPIVPGGGTGAGQGGVEGAQIAVSTAQHGPSSGVLGTSIGMPLTGSDAILRIGFSVICFSLGLVVLRATRNRRRL